MRRIVFYTLLGAVLVAACSSDKAAETNGPGDAGDGSVRISDKDGMTADLGVGEVADVVEEITPEVIDTKEPEEEINGFDYPCEPLTFESCVTACGSAGTHKCLKQWGPCIPPEEWCGNCVDDDCDGEVNEECPPNPACDDPIEPECPVAIITIEEGTEAWTGDTLHLSGENSFSPDGEIVKWLWSVQTPDGASGTFQPSPDKVKVTFDVDAAGQYLFSLEVWDDKDNQSCVPGQVVVGVKTFPPVDPEVGCADGEREGFLDEQAYPHIAGCSGAWDVPGITPDSVEQTCGGKGGDDGDFSEGTGCSAPDLCANDWHICVTWAEVAEKSPTGCAGSVPPDAKSKSLFFAMRQPSETGSVCGDWGDGLNDVFGCGNLGAGLPEDKNCGPLDRVLASTQPNSCGFNEAEPNLGPWECMGGDDSHLNEGKLVTKKGCPATSCSYDGDPIGSSDKGGVLCCRD